MYTSDDFQIRDEETFTLRIPSDRDYKILQLTDLHLGFGIFSGKKDRLALAAVTELIRRTKPDLLVLTGDSVFPFFPKSGTMNNRKQAQKLLEFLDSFQIPYTLVFGNYDCEMGSTCNKEQLSDIFATGKYAIFTKGRYERSEAPISGVGNFVLDLVDREGKLLLPLVLLDSNMYGEGWFYGGFDCIHEDQTVWCMEKLNERKVPAMAFFHMPPAEFKEAYEKMKLGDHSVVYEHGSIGRMNLKLANLIYIESNLHKLTFHVINEKRKEYSMYAKLDEMDEILEELGFCRIHKSYLINLKYVDSMMRYLVCLSNGMELSISRKKYKDAEEKWICYKGEI